MTQALLKADPHKWGEGKIHILSDDQSRTLCGKTRQQCPGEVVATFNAEADCLSCKNIVEAQERRTENQREWERRQQYLERERQEWANWYYNEYLLSPPWFAKRDRVFIRATRKHRLLGLVPVCEGCGEARAVQVHHLTYERVRLRDAREMLFDLVAVCRPCHEQLRQS